LRRFEVENTGHEGELRMTETKMDVLEYKSLGALLIEDKVITQEQLDKALHRQREKGGRLGELIVEMGFASEHQVLEALAKQLDIPYLSPDKDIFIDQELIDLFPERIVRQYNALPISIEEETLTVAMVDPFNITAIDDLRTITKCKINTAIISKSRLELLINRHYNNGLSNSDLQKILDGAKNINIEVDKEREEQREVNVERLREQVEEAPIVSLVNYIISNAINERASDIHVEPEEGRLNIRYRIDGVLHDIIASPKALQMAIISRIKIMSDMDIAERRLPQDGRFTVRQGARELDLRLSTLPAFFGENVVMRLLEKGSLSIDMNSLGFTNEQLEIFRRYISKPYGMLLLTGPTGSGKTTTLYSALSEIKSVQTNIVTVEDPVEYQIKSIRQVQVNPKIGLTFANGLRHILRQDPDIIMVGEIRDYETAEMAIRSALTGHLVFSALHTNDAVGTIVRLIDMGVERYLVCSSLHLAVAQRLVRKVCPHCRKSYRPAKEVLRSLGIDGKPRKNLLFSRGTGCRRCRETGYYGRTAICEMLEMKAPIRKAILNGADIETLRQVALELGMTTLRESGLQKVREGITTPEEVLRATIEED
jgi:type IV pilus assembly protein PilB